MKLIKILSIFLISNAVNAASEAVATVPTDFIKIGNLGDYQHIVYGRILGFDVKGHTFWRDGGSEYTAFGTGSRNFITDLKETLGGMFDIIKRVEKKVDQLDTRLTAVEGASVTLLELHADTKAELMSKIQALSLKIDEDIARVESKILAFQSTIGALSAARSISPAPQRAVAHAAGVLPPAVPVRTASPLKR
jgi:hypothetical protein